MLNQNHWTLINLKLVVFRRVMRMKSCLNIKLLKKNITPEQQSQEGDEGNLLNFDLADFFGA